MKNHSIKYIALFVVATALLASCVTPFAGGRLNERRTAPGTYSDGSTDTTNTGSLKWREFFTDPYLVALIDTALQNNQELNIILQEISIAQNEIRARKGEYLPFLNAGAAAGIDKPARYTSRGASDANNDIEPGKEFPDPLPDMYFGANLSWEVDIWKKLRNAKAAAVREYLATVEGKNFMVTNLVSEIAQAYYELMALDNQMQILERNIAIQTNALEIVKLQKQAAKVSELAVRRFEAEVANTKSHLYNIRQGIVETENRINFLVGRFPQPVQRNSVSFIDMQVDTVMAGVPVQLLANRPDIRMAEQKLLASKLDVKVARAAFYPSLSLNAGAGFQAYSAGLLLTTPASLLYYLGSDLAAPLINRNAIKARFYNSNSHQVQAVYEYEKSILNAYIEVANQYALIGNLKNTYLYKNQQVEALQRSVDISIGLFQSARADYMEVLLTQRDAMEARFELVETKMRQLNARVNMYRALGGGWK